MSADEKNALTISIEQAKARLALDILRFVNRSDGEQEHKIYNLAANFLITHFGGTVEDDCDAR